jgi:hypothetical protein
LYSSRVISFLEVFYQYPKYTEKQGAIVVATVTTVAIAVATGVVKNY